MIDIIITVYNKEKYIEEALNSVFSSVKEGDEIVIVNDGSTDNSSGIIEDFIRRNDKNKSPIKYINRKNNRGVCYSKKEGLMHCKNDFVIFLDGDDLLNYNLFKGIDRELINQNNLLIFSIKEFSDSEDKTSFDLPFNNFSLLQKIDYEKIILKNDSQNSLSNKIYYKDYLIKCFDEIDNSIDYGEDLLLNLKYLNYVSNLYYCTNPIIFYRKGIASLTTKWNESQFDRISLNPFKYREKYITNNNLYRYKYLPLDKYIEMTYTVVKNNYFTINQKKKIIRIFYNNLKKYNKLVLFCKLSLKNKYRFLYIFLLNIKTNV